MDAIETAELCGFWRQLIDSNRNLGGGIGFAFWKQDHVAPLLWGGKARIKFLRSVDEIDPGCPVAVWRAKAAPVLLAELERTPSQVLEVEDGFLRSRGLGADCIPPLSITVDRLGPHFDPKQPSELEWLLEKADFDAATIERARELRALIVVAGIGKYERATTQVERPAGNRRHILVPGQVEDDRAVTAGGCGLTSNLELLKRVREEAPDAFILYKPHPDVLAGHRRGAIAPATCLRYADKIVGELPIAALIAMVDEVHVNTSLAGFEALLRNKKVTTYGVPFYAGWGLTKDLGPVPARRTRRRNLDELVAATLLLYPRYLDPITRLPCPAEVVVARLSAEDQRKLGLLVGMRRLQGKLMRRLRSVIQ
jgi:capsular polysaccharide export protein